MKLRAGAILLAAAALLGAPAAAAPAKPRRIMSLNECTDLLVLQLVPKSRIASVSYRARASAWAVRPGLEAGVAVNSGTAEDLVAQRPDLILTGDFSTPTGRRLARLSGAPLVEVKSAESFEDIRRIVRQVGAAVGEPVRAQALVARMDAALAELAATAPPRPVTVAAWSGDSVPGRHTLANAIIEAAGAVNVATALADNRYGTFGLEQLLQARPDALLYSGGPGRQPLVLHQQASHPALLRLYAGRRIAVPEPLFTCGLPQSAEAARDLRRALSALPPAPRLR